MDETPDLNNYITDNSQGYLPPIPQQQSDINVNPMKATPEQQQQILSMARPGQGQYLPGEVYEQKLGSRTRQVIIAGKDANGNILAWYLPNKESAQLLGQKGGYLEPARWNKNMENEYFPLTSSNTSPENIKTAINYMFNPQNNAPQLNGVAQQPVADMAKMNKHDISKHVKER